MYGFGLSLLLWKYAYMERDFYEHMICDSVFGRTITE